MLFENNGKYGGTIVQQLIYIATLINASCPLSSSHQVEPCLLKGPCGQLHFMRVRGCPLSGPSARNAEPGLFFAVIGFTHRVHVFDDSENVWRFKASRASTRRPETQHSREKDGKGLLRATGL